METVSDADARALPSFKSYHAIKVECIRPAQCPSRSIITPKRTHIWVGLHFWGLRYIVWYICSGR